MASERTTIKARHVTPPPPLPSFSRNVLFRYRTEGGYCGIDDSITFYLAYGVPVVTMLVFGGVLALRCGPRQSSRGVQLLTLAAATLAAGAATTMQLAMTESNGTDNSGYELVTTALSALFAITFVCAAAMRQRAKRRAGSFKVSESFTMVAVGTNDDENTRDNDYEPDAPDKVNGDNAAITTTHHTNNDHFDNNNNNNNNDDDDDGDDGHEQRTRAGWNQTDQGTVRQSTDNDDLRAREQVEESNDEHDEHTESEVQSGKSVSQLYACY
jgi:hypothetical protein